jgi:uncharacterized protein YggL (DUF469 family)
VALRKHSARGDGYRIAVEGDHDVKKRLRKKKHVGEFTEWGRQIRITRTFKDGLDAFLDAFIEEAIEANGCYCGGGGCEDELDFVVELGRCSGNPDAKIKKITAWLDTRQDVRCWQVSEAFDLWHGECPELH